MAKRATTLFIEDAAIRVLETRGTQVEKWLSAPLEPGLVVHGTVVEPERVAAKLKETFALAGIKTKKLIVGLSEPSALYRLVTLPKLPADVLPEAVKREAERVIPVSLDEVYLSYQVIATVGEETQVFLATFSRSVTDTLLKTLQLSGLKPYNLDLVPLALCRVVARPAAIIVSLRANNFDIAIMVDRTPHVIRSLSLSGEAETMGDKLPIVTEELERTISFYNSSHTDKPLNNEVPIFVTGELPQNAESWPPLAGSLEPAANALPAQTVFPPGFEPDRFLVNIGLTLKGQPSLAESLTSLVDFNALPVRYLPEKTKLSRVVVPIGAILGIAVLGYVGLLGKNAGTVTTDLRAQITGEQNLITQLTKDITALQAEIKTGEARVKPLETQTQQAQTSANVISVMLSQWKDDREKLNGNLKQIFDLKPLALEIASISYGKSVAISGSASSESDIFQYARDLRAVFPDVAIRTISFNQDAYGFSMSLK